MKVVRGRAEREARRAREPAVGESFLEKDSLLEWGEGGRMEAPAEARAELGARGRVGLGSFPRR